MATQREILFVLKMQNQTQAAIRSLSRDLKAVNNEINAMSKSSGSSGLDKAAAAVRNLATETERGVSSSEKATTTNKKLAETVKDVTKAVEETTKAVSENFGTVQYSDTAYGRMVKQMEELTASGGDLAELLPKVTKGFEDNSGMVDRWWNSADNAIGRMNLMKDLNERMDVLGQTDFGQALSAAGASGMDFEDPANIKEILDLLSMRGEAYDEIRKKYSDYAKQVDEGEKGIISAARRGLKAEMKLKEALDETNKARQRNNLGIGETAKRMSTLTKVAVALVAALATGALVQQADAYQRLTSKLRQYTSSEENLVAVRRELFDSARNNFQSVENLSDLYATLTQQSDTLGISQRDILDTVDTLAMAFRAGGSSAAESASATNSLNQAFQRGRLNGSEFMAVIRSAPGVVAALEKGLRASGKEFATLEEYIKRTNPTVRELLDALNSQNEDLTETVAKMPATVGEGLSFLGTSVLQFIGRVNEASEATGGLATFFMRLGAILSRPDVIEAATKLADILGKVLNVALTALVDIIEIVADNWRILVSVMAAMIPILIALNFSAIIGGLVGMISFIYKAITAFNLLRLTMLSNPFGIIAVALAALIGYIVYFGTSTREVNGSVVSGWQELKAIALGVWAAIQKGIEVAWHNIKTVFKALVDSTLLVAQAFQALKRGDFAGALEFGEASVARLRKGFGDLRDGIKEAAEAYNTAFDQSIIESALANAEALKEESRGDGTIDTVRPPGVNIPTDESMKEAERRAKAIDDLKLQTKETEEATREQLALNEAIRKGPAAVRALNVELAYERELRQTLADLKKEGITGDQAKSLAEAAATAAQNMELAKQAETLSDLSSALTENIQAMQEQRVEAERGLEIMFETDRARRRQLVYQDALTRKEEELTAAYRRGQYSLTEYSKEMEKAADAARKFADQEQRVADAVVVNDLIRSTKNSAELAAEAYEDARLSLEAWMNNADNLRMAGFGEQARRAQEALEDMRPPRDMWDAVTQGLRDFGRESEVTLMSMRDLAAESFSKIGDAISGLVIDGKLNFKELARSIITDITRMIMKALIFRAIMSIFGGAAPLTSLTPDVQATIASNPGIFHTGGIAGAARSVRSLNPAAFAGAQRYHTGGIAGLKPGEVPIIAKKGEAILPTVRLPNGQMGVQTSGGGGGFSPNININVGGGGGGGGGDMSPEQQQRLAGLLEDELNVFLQRRFEEWSRPGGQLDTVVRQRR